jgi:PAS domain S-box-containing protein
MTNPAASIGQYLIENMSYTVIAVDKDGIINAWNRAAELMLGFSASEALGQHANLVIPLSMQAAHGNCFSKAMAEPKEFAIRKDITLPFTHKSGAMIKIKGHLALLKDAHGVPQGSAVIGAVAE